MTSDDSQADVVCLLPARNCADDLPSFFEAVEPLADAVVALDDGSTDGTLTALEAHPLVKVVLRNPPRDTYFGWDDASNRQRLLDAAADLCPRWIISIDADERMPADDARELRRFLDTSADPSAGFVLQVFRMVDDDEHYDLDGLWVGRLFGFEPGQRLPTTTLHLVPLPESIPRERWQYTTFRLQHVASLDAPRRAARFAKHSQADAQRAFQRSYEHLLAPPRDVERWQPRPPRLPPVRNGAWPHETADAAAESQADQTRPAITAVVISQNDEDRIERAVRAVVDQECPEPFEVIVVTSGTDRAAGIVRERFPTVRVVELPNPVLPGAARNAGLALARGRYVTFPGSHVELLPGSLAARLDAHRRGYAMVSGTTCPGTQTRAGWASFFLDHNSALPGRPSEPFTESPATCSYLRAALDHVGGFPEDMRAGEDSWMNSKLFGLGYGAWRERDVRVVHHTRCRTAPQLLRHHFSRGRAYGRLVTMRRRTEQRLFTRKLVRSTLVLYIPGRVRRVRRHVLEWGDDEQRREWTRSLPLVVAAIVASWLGTWRELARHATP